MVTDSFACVVPIASTMSAMERTVAVSVTTSGAPPNPPGDAPRWRLIATTRAAEEHHYPGPGPTHANLHIQVRVWYAYIDWELLAALGRRHDAPIGTPHIA